MKQIILIILLLSTLISYSQRRSRGKVLTTDFIGTWKLTKLADKHLGYLPDSVKKEFLKFTKDSVFVAIENKEHAGTWKLVDGQTLISIKDTNDFNYTWTAGDINSKFFTVKGLGYYKYFERVKK
jgi:hypothetical protein